MRNISLISILMALVIALLVIGAYEKHYELETIQIGQYHVYYYTRYGIIPDSANLSELQENPAVWDISWIEPTEKSGQYRWYKWTKGRGYVHEGSLFTKIYEANPATRKKGGITLVL